MAATHVRQQDPLRMDPPSPQGSAEVVDLQLWLLARSLTFFACFACFTCFACLACTRSPPMADSNTGSSGATTSHYYSPTGSSSGFYTQNGGASGGGYSFYQNSSGGRSYK